MNMVNNKPNCGWVKSENFLFRERGENGYAVKKQNMKSKKNRFQGRTRRHRGGRRERGAQRSMLIFLLEIGRKGKL